MLPIYFSFTFVEIKNSNSMAEKSYKPQKDKPMQVNEPAAVYQRVPAGEAALYVPTEYEQEIIMCSEKDLEEGRYCTQEEMDKKVAEWLS